MKRLLFLTALASGALSCASLPQYPPSYLSETPKTIRSLWSDSVLVHLDEKTEIQLNAAMMVGRRDRLEQAACLRIAKREGEEFWIDSVLSAAISPGSATTVGIAYHCHADEAPWHAHVVYARDGWDQCGLSDSTRDQGRGWSVYPVLLMQCGLGVDSIIAYRVRP